MDSLISAAARALASGDPLGALKHIALRRDAPALALRGIAMAQLQDFARARELLRQAARAFGPRQTVARARCVVAEAEVALAQRDFGNLPSALADAASTLEARADHANAWLAQLLTARQALLLGRLHDAELHLQPLPLPTLPPALRAMAELIAAELALRSLHIASADRALADAQTAAAQANIPALQTEVAEVHATLLRPAARRVDAHGAQMLRLPGVAALLASNTLVVDACRRGMGSQGAWYSLARRPVLFALARALAQAWPGDVGREALIATAFRLHQPDETHRARLRVEMGRLRALVKPLARIEATPQGFALRPLTSQPVVLLEPPVDNAQAALQALLADGAAWSTSALALALNASQRTVQRALAELEAQQLVRSVGRARAQRWLAPPLHGFTTILLLPTTLPIE